MAVFTAPMPESDSNPLAEIAALRAWVQRIRYRRGISSVSIPAM